MVRQIQFDNKFSHHDFNLILTAKEISPPEVKENFLDVPMGDGSIDLTDALRGEPSYSNRTIKFDFDLLENTKDWSRLKASFLASVHGKKVKVVEPDDPNFYYVARLKITSWSQMRNVIKVTVEGIANPYKYKKTLTEYVGVIASDSQLSFHCKNGRQTVLPKISVNNQVVVEFNNKTIVLPAGEHLNTDIAFKQGDNLIKFIGPTGTNVTVSYREGEF